MKRIVFLDQATIRSGVNLHRPTFEHEWTAYDFTEDDDIVGRLEGATIALTNKVPLRRATIDQLPDLKMIAVVATGYDVIDIDHCRARGITVSNVRGYAVNAVPEHVFALILALSRSLLPYRRDVADGEWSRSKTFCFLSHPMRDLADKTLGIIGAGAIGQAVAKIARAFGMRVLLAGRKGDPTIVTTHTPFGEVLETSDVITLHCPLVPETRELLALPEFRKMARRPILINTARGALVNAADVVTALDEGLVSGVGIDCLNEEPPAANHPLLAIADRPNVIITPHVAWASMEATQRLWDGVIGNIEAFVRGEPTHVVT